MRAAQVTPEQVLQDWIAANLSILAEHQLGGPSVRCRYELACYDSEVDVFYATRGGGCASSLPPFNRAIWRASSMRSRSQTKACRICVTVSPSSDSGR